MRKKIRDGALIEGMKIKKLFRDIDVRDARLDEAERTLDVPFSSELPVDRWFGREILSHEPTAIDLARAENGAMPFLFNHDPNELRGKVEKVWLDGRRLWARVRFAKTEKANEMLELIRDGMMPNVSFGYVVEEFNRVRAQDEKAPDEYVATKWAPYEVSGVTIPADHTVGFGRAAGDEFEVRVIENPKNEKQGGKVHMEIQVDVNKERSEAIAQERARAREIEKLGEKLGQAELARQLVDSGKTLDEAREAFLEKVSVRKQAITGNEEEVGLTEKEKGEFSIVRAINYLANPNSRSAREAAKFEIEVSEAGAKKRGREARGIFVPNEVLNRDLSKGTPSAGGYLVGTQHRPDMFIELFRKKSALQRAGVRVINGLQGDIAVPKMTGGATAYWVSEGGAPTESQQTFGQVAMTPKTVGAFTDMSRKLIIQSSPDIESLVRSDLATVLALAVDIKGMYGTGSSNEPLGIFNLGGALNTKDFAAATPTYPELVDMESKIAADDADVEGMAYLFNASMRGALKSAVKFSSAGSETIFEPGNTVNGYRTVVSNQLTDGDVIFGNFGDMMMGFWSGIDLNIDTAALATSGGVRVIVLQDVDVAVRHAESFCIGNDDQ